MKGEELTLDNTWSLIEQGRFGEAYKSATEEYEKTGSYRILGNRAISLKLLKDYKGALHDYLTILNAVDQFYINNKNYNDNLINKGDGEYIDVGVAYWLLSDYQQALKMWIYSMTLRLRFTSNIMIPPCIVYFAGVYLNDLKTVKEAKKYIKKRYKKTIPLGRFLLDEINEEELLKEIKPDSPLKERTLCKYEFYIASKRLEQGDRADFVEHLKRCRDAKGKYLEFEYFLAVGELDKMIIERLK